MLPTTSPKKSQRFQIWNFTNWISTPFLRLTLTPDIASRTRRTHLNIEVHLVGFAKNLSVISKEEMRNVDPWAGPDIVDKTKTKLVFSGRS